LVLGKILLLCLKRIVKRVNGEWRRDEGKRLRLELRSVARGKMRMWGPKGGWCIVRRVGL